MKKFIIIQLKEIEIVAFLIQLQATLNLAPLKMLPHITLRGPYSSNSIINLDMLKKVEESINAPILVKGVDYFDNPHELVVYFQVEIEGIEKAWWKPTYPISQHGLNPHITIYKGQNKLLAEKLIKYLNEVDLEFKCYNFEVAIHRSEGGQLLLFNDNKSLIDHSLEYTLKDNLQVILSEIKKIALMTNS